MVPLVSTPAGGERHDGQRQGARAAGHPVRRRQPGMCATSGASQGHEARKPTGRAEE